MQGLFAGFDIEGNLRYVSEVPAGAACGLRCFTCNAPLIAKKGDVNAWHLAHEPGQERPQCLIGALNMVRYTAMRMLARAASWRLSKPSFQCRGVQGTLHGCDWAIGQLTQLSCNPEAPTTQPMATYSCSGAPIQIHLYVTVGTEPVHHENQAAACLVYRIPVIPPAERLLDAAMAEGFIQQVGTFMWQYFPDFDGRKSTLQQAVAAERQKELDRIRDARARQAGQRWAAIRNAGLKQAEHWREPADLQDAEPLHVPAPQAPAAPVMGDGLPHPWTGLQKPQRSFMHWGLKDDSQWLMLTLADDSRVLVPWPAMEEGWDEALPLRLGSYDDEIKAIRIKDLPSTLMYLNAHSKTVLTLSYPLSPEELAAQSK